MAREAGDLTLNPLNPRFEARYGHQIARYYDRMSRDNLFEPEGDPQPGDPPF